jgi:hypothetical protein
MSQNESKAGSWSDSILARPLSLTLRDLELCSKPSDLWSHQMSRYGSVILTPGFNPGNSMNLTSKRAEFIAELCGSFWATGENWMNALLESIKTPADAVAAFRKMNERIAFYRDSEEGVSHVLVPYCQRLVAGGILELLGSVPKLPRDILSITTRFLLTSLHVSTQDRVPLIECLLRKTMLIELKKGSIVHGSIRGFVWNESNQRKRTKNMPAEANAVKSWTAQSYTQKNDQKVFLDGNGSTITITKFKLPSAGDLESYAWEIAANDTGVRARIFGYGFEDNLEDAAEAAYRAFYKAVTQVAFEDAVKFVAGREIVLLGKELTSEEFIKEAGKAKSYYFLVQMPQKDDRDGTLFCLNWHTIDKVKRTFKIEKVNGKVLTLEGGTRIDVDTVLCYVRQPENYVHTEVMCQKCGILGYPTIVGGRFIQGYGYQCGPCRDNSVEQAELSDGQFDE